MDRPTKTITTKNGHVVVLKEWLTAGENQEMQRVFLKSTKATFDKGAMRENPDSAFALDNLSGEAILDMQNKMIEVYVISIDEKTDDIVKTALSLRSEDYDEIIVSLNEEKKA